MHSYTLLHCCIAALLHCCIRWRLESFADYQSKEPFLANKYIFKVVFQQELTIFASRTLSPIELADPFLLHARWVQLISTVHWPSSGPQSTKDSNWEQLVEKPERYLCAASPPQKKKMFWTSLWKSFWQTVLTFSVRRKYFQLQEASKKANLGLS